MLAKVAVTVANVADFTSRLKKVDADWVLGKLAGFATSTQTLMTTRTDDAPTDRFSTAPISRLVGFQVEPAKSPGEFGIDETIGQAVVRLHCCSHHHNPMGRVHGGLIAALADAAMGIAFGRTLLAGEDFSTIDLQISFIRPIKEGIITATATVIERGLRIGFVRCEITNAKGKRIATASCTCTLVRET